MRNGMAQSPNHGAFRHFLDRRHGDHVAADGGSVAADLITLGCHVGTHVDGLAHISQDGRLHGGIDALDAQGAALAGADTIAFEVLPPGRGHALLPVHRILLVESGINIIELLQLEQLSGGGPREFLFVLSHLNIVGATGAPARPLAVAIED